MALPLPAILMLLLAQELEPLKVDEKAGQVTFGAGSAWPEDVRMEQDWTTAVAVATGQLNAQEAFLTGRVRLSGDQQKLIAAQAIFTALDVVFGSVRARTEYR